jgi:hypothetical protein
VFWFRIRTEHFANSSYLSAEVVAGGTMSSSSSEGIGCGCRVTVCYGRCGWLFELEVGVGLDFLVTTKASLTLTTGKSNQMVGQHVSSRYGDGLRMCLWLPSLAGLWHKKT